MMRERKESNRLAEVERSNRPKTIGVGAMLGLALVFASAVLLVTYSVRNDIRRQLLDVDSHVLSLLVQNELSQAERESGFVFEFEALNESEIWEALLETTTVDGVFAVQYFGLDGALKKSSSGFLLGNALSADLLEHLKDGSPYTIYARDVWLSGYVEMAFGEDRKVSLLDVYLPLLEGESTQTLGTARYLMDGSVVSGAFRQLDQRLLRQSSVAIGLGGAVMLALFWVAWKRLSEANSRVARQAERLRKANADLAMLARTSAVGSVTAHLIHGLKNPLAGLRQVVRTRHAGEAAVDEEEWRGASEAAERMQRMVEEVIGVLQDASSGVSFEIQSGDLLRELESRFVDEAERRMITLSVSGEGGVDMDSSVSNIALLVATNLVKNALEALGPGGNVSVVLSSEGDSVVLQVKDSGSGILEAMRGQLFSPVTSGKSGGAGIGLAISAQLARHLGGELFYVDTPSWGAVFEFRFPARDAFREGKE